LSGDHTKHDLCEIYRISRPTTDKWIARYHACGVQGLEEFVRTSHSHPNQTAEAERAMIVASKLQHQKWGTKKVLDRLRCEQPDVAWHADSTAGAFLKRAGLVRPRVRRHRVAPYTEPFRACPAPNQIWSADFKGRFRYGQRPPLLSPDAERHLLAVFAGSYRIYGSS
jgi:putative transposase